MVRVAFLAAFAVSWISAVPVLAQEGAEPEPREALHVLHGHSDSVTTAAFSPDGEIVVTASQDGTAKLWDAETGQLRLTLVGHEKSVVYATFDRSGKRVVTTSRDHTARVWDAGTGRVQRILEGHQDPVWRAGFSFDGARMFTASLEGIVRVRDGASGAVLRTLFVHIPAVEEALGRRTLLFHAEFSPDGTRILTASSDGARIWNAGTGEFEFKLSGDFQPLGEPHRNRKLGWNGASVGCGHRQAPLCF